MKKALLVGQLVARFSESSRTKPSGLSRWVAEEVAEGDRYNVDSIGRLRVRHAGAAGWKASGIWALVQAAAFIGYMAS